MPALLIIKATGQKAGYTCVRSADFDPGALVRANAQAQWRFVYVTDRNPEELSELSEPELRDVSTPGDAQRPQQERPKPEVVSPRKRLITVENLPNRPGQDASTYRSMGDARSYKVTRGQVEAAVRLDPRAILFASRRG